MCDNKSDNNILLSLHITVPPEICGPQTNKKHVVFPSSYRNTSEVKSGQSKVWFINKIVALRHKRIAKLFYKDKANYITFKMDWAVQ